MGSGKKRSSVISKKKQAKSGNNSVRKSKKKNKSMLKSFGGVAVFKGGTAGGLGGKQKNVANQLFTSTFRKAVGKAGKAPSSKKKQPGKKAAPETTMAGKKRSATEDAMEEEDDGKDEEDTNQSMVDTVTTNTTQKTERSAEAADFDAEMSNLRERAMADGEWTVVENHKKKKKMKRRKLMREEEEKEGGRPRKQEEEPKSTAVSNPLFGSLAAPTFGVGSQSYDPVGEAANLMMSSGTLQGGGGASALFTVGTTARDVKTKITKDSLKMKRNIRKATRKLSKALENRFSLLEDKEEDREEGWGAEFDTTTTTTDNKNDAGRKTPFALAPPKFAFEAPSLTTETSLVKALGGTTVTKKPTTANATSLFVFGGNNSNKTDSVTRADNIPFLTFKEGSSTKPTTTSTADTTKKTFFAFGSSVSSSRSGSSFANPSGTPSNAATIPKVQAETLATTSTASSSFTSSSSPFQFAPASFSMASSSTPTTKPDQLTLEDPDVDPDL